VELRQQRFLIYYILATDTRSTLFMTGDGMLDAKCHNERGGRGGSIYGTWYL
jgi:hypothetical protein